MNRTATTRRNPIVFAAGCARSGTTLLQRMLDNHPELAVANDTHFILDVVERSLITNGDPPLTPRIVEDTLAYRRFPRFGLSDDQVRVAAETAQTYSEFVSNLYDTFGAIHGKPLAGEKTPSYCIAMPVLHGLFPDARFILLLRDGRDVALSVREWADRKGRRRGPAKVALWDQDPLAAIALWWAWSVRRAMEDAERLGPDCVLTLRYAELVNDAEGSMLRVCAFLGLEYSQSMARYYAGKEQPDGEGDAKVRWLRPTAGLRDWRNQMSPEDVAVFSGLAGDVLEDAGYEPASGAAGIEASRRIDAARIWNATEGPWAGSSLQTA